MSPERKPLLPVVLGGDFGVYGMGRSFHQAYGCRVLCVNSAPTAAISRSTFFDHHPLPEGATDEQVIHELLGIGAAYPDYDLVLMANHDLHSVLIARHREELSQYYALPFPSTEVIDRLTDKAAFAQACADLGIPTPQTVIVDFAGADSPQWTAPHIPFEFPIVAKSSAGEPYDRLEFEGKRKIWFIESAEELTSLWQTLIQAGFRDRFLVQELIPGDNTAMRSITAYVDSRGQVSLIGSARVLLEDHAPTMIGNPVAMITEPFPQLWADASKLLTTHGYRGFANFDVKIDPRDGRAVFFEVNPRIGRNNWYMTAAGHNPMIHMVSDLVYGQPLDAAVVEEEILYSMVPDSLLLRYIRDESLRERVHNLMRTGRRHDPLLYPSDRSLMRTLVVRAQKLNHIRKFRRYYPEPTDRSF